MRRESSFLCILIIHYDIWSEGVNSLTISIMVASKQVIRENKLSNKRASFCKTLISNLKGNVLLLKGTIADQILGGRGFNGYK